MQHPSVVGPLLVAAGAIAPAVALRRWRRSVAAERASRVWIVLVATLTSAELATRLVAKRLVSFETNLERTGYEEYRPGRIALGGNRVLHWGTRNRALPPVEVRTNGDGLRVGDGLAGEPGPRRVLFVGDSFTFGVGLDAPQTLPAQAAALLRARTGADWRGLNAGVPGYNVWSSIERFEHLAPRYRPAAVVVTMGSVDFVRGDINDDARRYERSWLFARSWALRLLRFGTLAVRYHYPVERWSPPRREAYRAALLGVVARLGDAAAGVPAVLHVLKFDGACRDELAATRREGAVLVACTAWNSEDASRVIPGDGHPNAAGARWLAERAVTLLADVGVER